LKLLTLSLTVLCLALSAPAFAGVIYNDGPTTGTNLSLYIDGPNTGGPYAESISDGFVATASGTASSLNFGVWVTTGSTPTAVSWWLGTTAFGSDISSGSTAQVAYTYLLTTNLGFDVYEATVTGLSGNLTAGNAYWLTLGNGNDSFGDQGVAWDISNGPATCMYTNDQGGGACPYGAEAFTLNSSSSPTPEPGSMMMLGTGVLGLAGVLRRKINL
jgi:hypothetical protein